MLTFSIEPIENVWDEMTADWIANWGEEYVAKGELPNLSKERYVQYEKIGYYFQYVARDGEKAAGYCGIYLSPSMHSQQLIAAEDIMYLKPEYRGGMNAKRFFAFIEQDLKNKGAISISCTVKPESPAARLLGHLDYKVIQYQFEKRLT